MEIRTLFDRPPKSQYYPLLGLFWQHDCTQNRFSWRFIPKAFVHPTISTLFSKPEVGRRTNRLFWEDLQEMEWFPGTIADAIASSKTRSCLFVVFVEGTALGCDPEIVLGDTAYILVPFLSRRWRRDVSKDDRPRLEQQHRSWVHEWSCNAQAVCGQVWQLLSWLLFRFEKFQLS